MGTMEFRSLILHDFQSETVKLALEWLYDSGDLGAIIALPTGVGKSVVCAELVRVVNRDGYRVLVLTHKQELISQNASRLLQHCNLKASIVCAGLKSRKQSKLTFATIQTFSRLESFLKFDLVIIDECHLVNTKNEGQYNYVLNELDKHNPIRVIGLSATPFRLKSHLLEGSIFSSVIADYCTGKKFTKLIDDGFLAPVETELCKSIDLKGVKTINGDYSKTQLQTRAISDDVIEDLLNRLSKLYDRNSILIFCVTIAHVDFIFDVLNARFPGVRKLHSKCTKRYNEESLSAFKSFECKYLISCDQVTTGFDHPGTDVIVLLRPTQSTALYIQMVGRGTRSYPGKINCLLLDYGTNADRLGPINEPRAMTKRKRKGDLVPLKVCPECSTFCYAAVRICECGYKFEFQNNDLELEEKPSQADVIVYEPIRTHQVFKTTYHAHIKDEYHKMIRVEYHLRKGIKNVCEFLYFCTHTSKAKYYAKRFWQQRTDIPLPLSFEQIYEKICLLSTPAEITVNYSGEYPKVVSYSW